MNEISNFCNGECSSLSQEATAVDGLKFDPNNPPYKINNQGSSINLNIKTLDMDAVHYGELLEYNTHNLFGMYNSSISMDMTMILFLVTWHFPYKL